MKSLDNAAVLYCDNHLLVVNKPPGVATQPDLEEAAKAWIKHRFKKEGAVFLHVIHRLDKPASGLVLCARTSKALSRLQEAMRRREIQKTYVAEVEGHLSCPQAELKHFLVHGDHKAYVSAEGKEAILRYRVIKEKKQSTVVEIELETGRYHQIRAQFAALGHPLLGDEKYGSKVPYGKGIALTHVKLVFMHPVTKERVEVKLEH